MHRFGFRISISSKESISAAFGRAPQGRGAPLWRLSLLDMLILTPNLCILYMIIHILYLIWIIPWIIRKISYFLPFPLEGPLVLLN